MEDNRIDRQIIKAVEVWTSTCGCYRCNRRVAKDRCTRVTRASGIPAYLCDSCRNGRIDGRTDAKKRAAGYRRKGGAR